MNRKGFAPVLVLVIITGIVALGGLFYFVHKEHAPTVSRDQSIHSPSSTPTPSSTITTSSLAVVEKEPSISLSPINNFHGEGVIPGTNTIDGTTFIALPVYDIGETYNNRLQIQDPTDGYLDYHLYESLYRFEDFKFVNHFGSNGYQVDIYKGSDLVAKAPGQSHEYGAISIKTFSYGDRDYFVIGGAGNCGNGGCNFIYTLYSYGNGTSTAPIKIWENNWGWGHGGATPFGSEHGGDLALVVAYQGGLVLFSADQPAVRIDVNGKIVGHVTQNASTTIEDILTVAFSSDRFVRGEYHTNLPNGIVLVNSQGKRTGKDPLSGVFYHEIQGTSYGEVGISPTNQSGELFTANTLPSGHYDLYIIGGKDGQYFLDTSYDGGAIQEFKGTIQSGAMAVFSQDYNANNVASSTLLFKGVVSSSTGITARPPHNLPLPLIPGL